MGMTDGYCQGIRGVFRQYIRKIQHRLDHLLDLLFLGTPVTDHRFFYFQGRVLKNRDMAVRRDKENHAPHVTLLYETFDILSVKNVFN